jgi:acetyl esterase/lipase
MRFFQTNPSRARNIAPPFLILSTALAPILHAGAGYQVQANIRYSPFAETVLDILQPASPALEDRPGVLVIHGGGWVKGAKEDMLEQFCLPYLRKGFVVANADYRLASVAPAPAAVNDVLEAARWFRGHAADYKVDPKKIIVTGASAGGHLALLAALLPASAGFGPETKFAAVVDFYGIADLPDQLEGARRQPYAVAWLPEQPGSPDQRVDQRMDLARRLSPLTYVRRAAPPILAIHGAADPIVPFDQSARLVKALKDVRADAELIAIPDGRHGFEPAQMDAIYARIFAWLKKRKIY